MYTHNVEALLDGDKLSQNFTQDVLREVRGLSVYSQLEKLRRSVRNQESHDLLRQIKTVLAAQISLKYAADSFERKMEYDRRVASIARLVAQLCDEKKYNNEHRMYAYYALKKRCNEILGSYSEYLKLKSSKTAEKAVKVEDCDNYSIKFMADSFQAPSRLDKDSNENNSVIEIDFSDCGDKKRSFSKLTFGIKQFIKNNFDVPAFAISVKKAQDDNELQIKKNRLLEELSSSMVGAVSKVRGIIFQNLVDEENSCDLTCPAHEKSDCIKPEDKKLRSSRARSCKPLKDKDSGKLKAAKKKKTSKN
jgi:hypothetical protein